jgi:hypothetical protein
LCDVLDALEMFSFVLEQAVFTTSRLTLEEDIEKMPEYNLMTCRFDVVLQSVRCTYIFR